VTADQFRIVADVGESLEGVGGGEESHEGLSFYDEDAVEFPVMEEFRRLQELGVSGAGSARSTH